MNGKAVEGHLNLHLQEGLVLDHSIGKTYIILYVMILYGSHSYLKELVPVFNKAAKSVIEERMRSHADGKTVVDLKEVFYQVAFQIISQVIAK